MRARRWLPLLLLAACSYFQDTAESEANIIRPGNFKAGSGVIQSVSVLTNANKATPRPVPGRRRPDPNLYRLALNMYSDGFQTVDVDNGNFRDRKSTRLNSSHRT